MGNMQFCEESSVIDQVAAKSQDTYNVQHCEKVNNGDKNMNSQFATIKFHKNIVDEHRQTLIDNGCSFDENDRVIFPQGFTLSFDPCDERYMICKNSNDDIIFTMFVKDTLYETYAYLTWVSKEDSDKMKKEEENKKILSNIDQNEILATIKNEWSEQNKYIVYSYRDGTREATLFAGKRCSNDMIIEFSDHELIGFISDANLEQFENIVRKYRDYFERRHFSHIVVRELPDGLVNLHRFERNHLFGEHNDCKYIQKKSHANIITKSQTDIFNDDTN